ncbi:hypothetical protein FHS30_000100 [Simiduia aestuariiviva]|uniref:Uncharacterized protein n=1 Tax=Simiduia aestuariiviva TaxID=1510459 RepID=A0A839UFV7_9GAMM|nr:hypothetical protein [Simiduia aestuariiviva]
MADDRPISIAAADRQRQLSLELRRRLRRLDVLTQLLRFRYKRLNKMGIYHIREPDYSPRQPMALSSPASEYWCAGMPRTHPDFPRGKP